LAAEALRPSDINNCTTSAVPPAVNNRRSDKITGKKHAAPAPAVAAGAAARAAQPHKAGEPNRRAAKDGDKGSKGELAAKALAKPQLTRADVQQLLEPGRLHRAAAALEAMQKEAEQADCQSRWMWEYLQSAKTSLLSCCDADAKQQAERLYHRVEAWKAVQERVKVGLARAVGKTQMQLHVITEAWEGKLGAMLDSTPDKYRNSLQVLPKEAAAMVKAVAAGIGSMEGCFKQMQQRYATFVQSAQAQRESVAATTYFLIRVC
jgi:hypothetical protein